jgi:hypothetical protein
LSNFTLLDILGTLRALPFFALIFLAPGYLIGRASNVLRFRRRSPAEQWLLSMGISIVTMPIALNLLSRGFPLRITVAFCWLVAFIAIGDLLVRWRNIGFQFRLSFQPSTWIALVLATGWAIICLFSLPDLQLDHRLYSSAAVADLGVRSALVASAMHGGSPPANPFFFPGAIVKLRYYYYWYVLTAIPGIAAGVEPRAALFASSIWSGWILSAAAAIFLKHFYGVRRRIRTATVFAMALLGVTGLDALYVLFLYLKYRIILSDMEVWDTDQVTSWMNSLLWVPHHVAATSACMVGFVFLWHAGRKLHHSPPQRLLLAALAAIGFASAAGLSVYVTFAFILFLFAAAIFWLLTRRFDIVRLYLAVGALVAIFSIGYLRDLRATGAHVGDTQTSASAPATAPSQPSAFATLALRHLPPTLAPLLLHAVHDKKLANIALRPFALIPILFIEFGFFFLVGIRQASHDLRERKIHAASPPNTPGLRDIRDIRWLTWLMLSAGLWVALMMHSTVITNNDLSFRGVEVAQFILLIWGAVQLAGGQTETRLATATEPPAAPIATFTPPPRIGWLAGSLLILGLLTTLYQLTMLRFYLYGSDQFGWTNPVIPQSEFGGSLGEVNQQVREAYATLDRVLPPTAKVQFGAAPKLNLQLLYYSRYQQLDGVFPGCATAFGGSATQCRQLGNTLAPIFGSAPPPSATDPTDPAASKAVQVPTLKTAAAVYSLCRDLGIDALLITGEDPVWNEPEAWPRQMKPVFSSDFVAAYTCR